MDKIKAENRSIKSRTTLLESWFLSYAKTVKEFIKKTEKTFKNFSSRLGVVEIRVSSIEKHIRNSNESDLPCDVVTNEMFAEFRLCQSNALREFNVRNRERIKTMEKSLYRIECLLLAVLTVVLLEVLF